MVVSEGNEEMINAVFDMVIVEVIKKDSGAIVIPDYQEARRDKCDFHGKVISIGPDFKDKNLKVEDKLFFPRNEGYKIEWEGREYMSLRNRWCMAKEE